MTKEEIKTLISAKIAGQGNQVDIGNGLVEVLNALADTIEELAMRSAPIELTPFIFDNLDKEAAARQLGISVNNLDRLVSEPTLVVNNGDGQSCLSMVTRNDVNDVAVSLYHGVPGEDKISVCYILTYQNGLYSGNEV